MFAQKNTRRGGGLGRVLIVVYAILALAATGRSVVQIIERFHEAPLAFSLSAAAAVVYILATCALILSGSALWHTICWITVSFELVGVLVIGTMSIFFPALFPQATVWSFYGMGYLFVPLVLPFLGLWWLNAHPPSRHHPAANSGA